MVKANSALRASLAIYLLISNAPSCSISFEKLFHSALHFAFEKSSQKLFRIKLVELMLDSEANSVLHSTTFANQRQTYLFLKPSSDYRN